ncbi:MAG: hypothetical protein WC554_05085 [Clostridia bacterium]|jgi:hypothetical protein
MTYNKVTTSYITQEEQMAKTIDFDKEQKSKLEEEKSKLVSALTGRKITKVYTRDNWDGHTIAEVILTLDDYTTVRINAQTECGCEECNPDGSASDYLDFFVCTVK